VFFLCSALSLMLDSLDGTCTRTKRSHAPYTSNRDVSRVNLIDLLNKGKTTSEDHIQDTVNELELDRMQTVGPCWYYIFHNYVAMVFPVVSQSQRYDDEISGRGISTCLGRTGGFSHEPQYAYFTQLV